MNGHDPFGDKDWMIKDQIVGRAIGSGRHGDTVHVRLTSEVTYFRGSQSPRTFTCMAQPDLGRPMNHA